MVEKGYPHTQKEALAIVWAVERFSYYLTNINFTIWTDSEANKFIFGSLYRSGKRSITRAETWALRLLPFNFQIKCVPGDQNIADVLSRLIDDSQVDEPFDDDNERHMLYDLDTTNMSMSWSDIQLASEEDEELTEVRLCMETGKWPRHLGRYECLVKQLRSLDALVFKDDLVVLPKSLRERALATAHEGHVGCGATKRILRDHFWWPNMSKEADKYVSGCTTCLSISQRNPPVPLISRSLPEGPWEILQIDFLSVQWCGSGHFLVCVDIYSRFLNVIEMKQIDASSTNAALCKIFKTWGLPLAIQSDNGPPFKSKEFIQFWEQKGVTVRKSIPLSAQSNGAVERQNQGIIKAISAAKIEKKNWSEALEEYVHLHNTRKQHARLGVTPFELLAGWRYRGTVPSLWDAKIGIERSVVREDDAHAKLLSKNYADKHRGAKESNIKVGDKVVVFIPQKKKTDPSFSKETFTILARDGAKVVIRSEDGTQFSRNVRDVKLLPCRAVPYDHSLSIDGNSQNSNTVTDLSPMPRASNRLGEERPQRHARKPAWLEDMELY
ncbi:uncharacterized protein K02A2.6-like [Anopheles funestus]|uniref:uncharacterized protein K02A2.6-like n=1 Tax=Anopheles funestus TaxID=62324 RepID=UPI0020C6D474|nr:uncharacterized protein K02A2.6-like [Anopheles funestus]